MKTFRIQRRVKLEHLVYVSADDVRILSSEFKKTKIVVSNRLVDITMKLPQLITVRQLCDKFNHPECFKFFPLNLVHVLLLDTTNSALFGRH